MRYILFRNNTVEGDGKTVKELEEYVKGLVNREEIINWKVYDTVTKKNHEIKL